MCAAGILIRLIRPRFEINFNQRIMSASKLPEIWLRGPLDGITPFLQPVAHALLQAKEEINELMKDFPEHLLWEKPAGVASPGFHLQHLAGVLNRLFTYAEGKSLSEEQLTALKAEGKAEAAGNLQELLQIFNQQVEKSIEQLKVTAADELTEFRGVGRAQLPSTVLGLLVHGAEHTMRHMGQLLVTVRILLAGTA